MNSPVDQLPSAQACSAHGTRDRGEPAVAGKHSAAHSGGRTTRLDSAGRSSGGLGFIIYIYNIILYVYIYIYISIYVYLSIYIYVYTYVVP